MADASLNSPKPALVAAGVILCGALLGGCNPSGAISPDAQTPTAGRAIDVFQLAGRLDLRVARCSRTGAHLVGPGNSVSIFPDPGGSVYVNAVRLAHRGEITSADGAVCVPESLVSSIRSSLRRPKRRAPPAPAPPKRRPVGVVAIDPGHGGKDPGAIAVNGMFEKDVVLAVALIVRKRLASRNVRVVMTRADDRFIELNRRAEIANEARADLFVSIHADAAPNRRAHGHTLYVAPDASTRSHTAARCVDRRLTRAGIHSRGVRQADFRVLVRTTCPAVLVETGYLSNRWEAARLASAPHRRAVAEAIAAGILDCLRP